jgi:microcystin-dependent protein
MTSYCRTPVTYTAHQRAIVGDTKMSVIANDHLGWLRCDGRTLNVNDFYFLWRVIGYSFGGSSTTFNLPNASGRVPGVIGTGTDVNSNTQNLALGDMIGEYVHTLTIDEMPTHNHGVDNVPQPNNSQTSSDTHNHGGSTGNSITGITINTNGAHSHNITTANSGENVPDRVGQARDDVEEGPAQTDSAGAHNHSITDPAHSHSIASYSHFHTINSAGGSNVHNNIQPMIGLGNMFIFSGKYLYPSDATTPFAGYPYLSNSQIL